MAKEVMDFVGEYQFINWINLPRRTYNNPRKVKED